MQAKLQPKTLTKTNPNNGPILHALTARRLMKRGLYSDCACKSAGKLVVSEELRTLGRKQDVSARNLLDRAQGDNAKCRRKHQDSWDVTGKMLLRRGSNWVVPVCRILGQMQPQSHHVSRGPRRTSLVLSTKL